MAFSLSPLLAFVLLAAQQASATDAPTDAPPTFDWSGVIPSTKLEWVPCYTPQTQCTRLSVPLNYSNPDTGSAALALIRIPSSQTDSATYRGPLLFNPGGPGGSGVEAMLELGGALAQVAGPDFDIISWDPRGVGRTTPTTSFFKDDIERALFDFGPNGLDLDWRSDKVEDQWARMQVLGRLVKDRDVNGTLAHVTTDNVARDMLTIAQAHGREKVNYWGISYGTTLGSTFAALFPDKIERLILDGVMDVDAYYATDWSNALSDTEKTVSLFLDGCHAAGPRLCPFHEKSRRAMDKKLQSLFARVSQQPIPAYSPSLPKYGTINLGMLKNAILRSMYIPPAAWALLGQALQDLTKGDGAAALQLTQPQAIEPMIAVTCTDGLEVKDGPAQLRAYAKSIDHISTYESVVAGIKLLCSGWKIHPNHFRGPISAKNTSFPILFIGNTADNVTPLANAKKVSKSFPGSVVLTQDTPGHTSFAAVSECTLVVVNGYLNSGVLPKPGTVCPGPKLASFFEPPQTETSDARVALLKRSLREGYIIQKKGGPEMSPIRRGGRYIVKNKGGRA